MAKYANKDINLNDFKVPGSNLTLMDFDEVSSNYTFFEPSKNRTGYISASKNSNLHNKHFISPLPKSKGITKCFKPNSTANNKHMINPTMKKPIPSRDKSNGTHFPTNTSDLDDCWLINREEIYNARQSKDVITNRQDAIRVSTQRRVQQQVNDIVLEDKLLALPKTHSGPSTSYHRINCSSLNLSNINKITPYKRLPLLPRAPNANKETPAKMGKSNPFYKTPTNTKIASMSRPPKSIYKVQQSPFKALHKQRSVCTLSNASITPQIKHRSSENKLLKSKTFHPMATSPAVIHPKYIREMSFNAIQYPHSELVNDNINHTIDEDAKGADINRIRTTKTSPIVELKRSDSPCILNSDIHSLKDITKDHSVCSLSSNIKRNITMPKSVSTTSNLSIIEPKDMVITRTDNSFKTDDNRISQSVSYDPRGYILSEPGKPIEKTVQTSINTAPMVNSTKVIEPQSSKENMKGCCTMM